MIQARSTNPVPIPADVATFAAEQGVSKELPAVIEMTQRVFPQASVSVVLEDDPEIPNDWHIVVEAKDIRLSVEEALEARWEWHGGLFENCPAPKAYIFRVRMEVLP